MNGFLIGRWGTKCVLMGVMAAWLITPAGTLAQKKATVAAQAEMEPAQDNATDKHDKDDPRARAEYLEKKRSGGKPVPRAARLNALRQQQQMMVNEGKDFWAKRLQGSAAGTTQEQSGTAPQTNSTAPVISSATPETNAAPPALSASQWVNIGPTSTLDTSGGSKVAGRVTALAIDPTNTNVIYLGGAQGGVWKSTDAGVNWTPLTDNRESLAIGSIVLDPQNHNTIYAGTGEENFNADSYYGVGIMKSTDGGANWSVVAGSTAFSGVNEPECDTTPQNTFNQGIGGGCGGLRIGSLAASVQGGITVLLAAVQGGFSNTGGLYRSTDGGSTWTLVSGNIPPVNNLRYIADSVVFANPTVAYAGIHNSGVFKSTDGGVTFNAVNTGINVTSIARVNVAAAVSDTTGQTAYAAVEDKTNSTLSGLYKTIDGGANWTLLTGVPDFCGGFGSRQCFYDMMVAVSPVNSNLVFIGGSGCPNDPACTTGALGFLFHAVDGGAGGASSWFADINNIHADQHAGAFTPDGSTFYIGNDGGVYKTTSIGSSSVNWTNLNYTLGLTQFYGYFAMDPDNSQITYGGAQDNGTQKFTGDLVWNEITCGDGAGVVLDSNSGRVFANCNDVDVRESADGSPGSFGGSNSAGTNISTADGRVFIPPMVGDHSNPQRLYFGTNKIYQAQSLASPSWAAVSGQVTGSSTNGVTNIDLSNDGNTLYSVSEDGKVFRGDNMLTTHVFTDVTGTSQFQAGNYITSVHISPFDATNNTAYITLSGFTGAHIYKTIAGGVTWTNVTGNLPNTPVNDLVIDPDIASTLYAATDVGVFVSKDDGTTWNTLQTVLPKIAVLGLKLHRASRTLRAATHGRGMWDLYVPSCNPASGPCLVPAPVNLNFGSVAVGASSAPQTITLTNNTTTTANLTVNGVTLSGSDFIQNNNCGVVAPGNSCAISVTFSPRGGLLRKGSITVYSNGGNPAMIALQGTGLVVPVNDDFANGITIPSLPFTATVITNGATSSSSDPLPPNTNTCVGVYNPPDALGYATSATYNHHSIWFHYTPQSQVTVSTIDTLQTVGVDTVISVWTGSPGAFNFVACNDDTTSAKQSQIQGLTLSANTTYHILVTGYYDHDFGAIVFNMSGPNNNVFAATPGLLNFTALLNRRSAAQTVTITNNSGSPQTVSSVTAGGDYAVSHNCGALASGASCSASVTFTPVAVGQENSVLTINDGAAGNPQVVGLTGFAFNFNLNNPRPHRSNRSGGVVQGQRQQFSVALDTATGGGTIPVSLSCADAPPGSTCSVSPAQVSAGDGSTDVTVTLQTSAPSAGSFGGARTRRLGGGTPLGTYNMRVTARVGEVEQSTTIPVTVTSASGSRSVRISP